VGTVCIFLTKPYGSESASTDRCVMVNVLHLECERSWVVNCYIFLAKIGWSGIRIVCLGVERNVYLHTVFLYAVRVALEQSGNHYHHIVYCYLVLLKHCLFGVKQQSIIHSHFDVSTFAPVFHVLKVYPVHITTQGEFPNLQRILATIYYYDWVDTPAGRL